MLLKKKEEKLMDTYAKLKNMLEEISQKKAELKKELENEKNPLKRLLKSSAIAYYEDLEINLEIRISEIEDKLSKLRKKSLQS